MGSANTSETTTVSREGKISLPARQRRAVGIEPGTRVSVRTEGSRIIVQSMDALLDDIEERTAALMTNSVPFTVGEFIAEKYAEAARDEYDR